MTPPAFFMSRRREVAEAADDVRDFEARRGLSAKEAKDPDDESDVDGEVTQMKSTENGPVRLGLTRLADSSDACRSLSMRFLRLCRTRIAIDSAHLLLRKPALCRLVMHMG